jgi:glutamyl-tRNA synthetase
LDWHDKEKDELVAGFKEAGYLPEAVTNFLALLGWHTSSNEELFTMDDLIKDFSIERIGKSGVKFDINKAKWFNQQYLRNKPVQELTKFLMEGLEKNNIDTKNIDQEKAEKICNLMTERATFPDDIWKEALYLFQAPKNYDEKALQKNWQAEGIDFVKLCLENLKNHVDNWKSDHLKQILHDWVEEKGYKIGKVMPALRLSISGVTAGADLSVVLEIIGAEETLKRIENSLQILGS